MAQVTIHKDPGVEVVVIDGAPPVDQSAEVAEQAGLIADLTAQLSAVTGERDAAQAAAATLADERDAIVADHTALIDKVAAMNAAIDAAQGQA